MSIYLDISAAVHHRAGLGRYADSLTRALLALEPGRYSLFYNRESGVEPLPGLETVPTQSIALGYKPWRMLIYAGHVGRIGFDHLLPNASLYHAMEHLLMPLRGIPTVLTVHDLIFRHLPGHHKPLNRWYLNATMPLYCRRATHIIAVSDCTRQDLIATYCIPEPRITVIHEAADPRFQPQPANVVTSVRKRYGLPERY
ncbi:MAG: glycosyltransferase family 4 protein, partial [Chloroflexi bacterium]|nr:glycosyltransferase family 4 protein [Chloroflexota bacterium]